MSNGLVPRELAIIRGAITELKRVGLSIDSFSISFEKWIELENLGIAAKHIAVAKSDFDPTKIPSFPPRTIAGIPVNVTQ